MLLLFFVVFWGAGGAEGGGISHVSPCGPGERNRMRFQVFVVVSFVINVTLIVFITTRCLLSMCEFLVCRGVVENRRYS